MNDETALQIIEDYFAKKATVAEYSAALAYFAAASPLRSRLARLYHDLMQLGGLDHASVQALMPLFLDSVARRTRPPAEREQFLLHLSLCGNCAQEYAELLDFQQNLVIEPKAPRFKVPKARPGPTVISWPERLQAEIEQLINSAKTLKAKLRFTPVIPALAVREALALYEVQPTQRTLFHGTISDQKPFTLQVTATRLTAETSSVTIQLQGTTKSAGHIINLGYEGRNSLQTTNAQGQVIFQSVPVAALSNLEIEVEINL